MKILIPFICFFISINKSKAQKQFQGSINYKIIDKNTEKETLIKAFFGVKKIKVTLISDIINFPNDPNEIIIDLNNYTLYEIYAPKKMVTIKNIKEEFPENITKLNPLEERDTTILNYKSSAYSLVDSNNKNLTNRTLIPLYLYSDSLPFLFDSAYSNNELLKNFGNGKCIIMGRKESIGEGNDSDYNFFLYAISVEEKNIPDSLFFIPHDYKISTKKKSEEELLNDLKKNDDKLKIVEENLEQIKSTSPPPLPPQSNYKSKSTKKKTVSKNKK
jgi:hypothetical protein